MGYILQIDIAVNFKQKATDHYLNRPQKNKTDKEVSMVELSLVETKIIARLTKRPDEVINQIFSEEVDLFPLHIGSCPTLLCAVRPKSTSHSIDFVIRRYSKKIIEKEFNSTENQVKDFFQNCFLTDQKESREWA